MALAATREIGMPDGSTVSLYRALGGRIRVSDAEGANIRTITRADVEGAAMSIVGLPIVDPVPRSLADTLAYAALAQAPLSLVSVNEELPAKEEVTARAPVSSRVADEAGPALALPDIFDLANRALQLSRVSESNKSTGEMQREARGLLAQVACVPCSQLSLVCRHLCEAIVEYAASPERMQRSWGFAIVSNAELLRSIVKFEREGMR